MISDGSLPADRASSNVTARRSSPLGFGTFLTAFTPYGSSATASIFDHGSQSPPTEGAGGRCLGVECGHRSHESREGSFKYYASQGCLWLRLRYPHNDKSEFPSILLLTDRRLKCAQDAMANRMDYVELGLACADVCTALDRGLNGKRLNDLNSSMCEAIKQLTT